jgi:uncharacterized protein (TIGR00251 family)
VASRASRRKPGEAVSHDDSRTQVGALPAEWVRQSGAAVLVLVHARPGAKHAAVVGVFGGRLKVAVDAPPVDGKANDALIDFLADQLHRPRSSLAIQSGAAHRDKCVRIESADAAEVAGVLGALLPATARSK